ncbi:hypothetical protein FB99_06630 [Pantoea agglomerans]|nr:hypothetical protein FB99_06630 [Pantoea agglomerans]
MPEPERYHPDDLSLNNKKPGLSRVFITAFMLKFSRPPLNRGSF